MSSKVRVKEEDGGIHSNNPDEEETKTTAVYRDEVIGHSVDILFDVDGSETKQFYTGQIRKMSVELDSETDESDENDDADDDADHAGKLVTLHFVKFEDGETYWFDLAAQEKMGRLRWHDKRQVKANKRAAGIITPPLGNEPVTHQEHRAKKPKAEDNINNNCNDEENPKVKREVKGRLDTGHSLAKNDDEDKEVGEDQEESSILKQEEDQCEQSVAAVNSSTSSKQGMTTAVSISTTSTNNNDPETLVNQRIAKYFGESIYLGTVDRFAVDAQGTYEWHVRYDDEDEAFYEKAELQQYIDLYHDTTGQQAAIKQEEEDDDDDDEQAVEMASVPEIPDPLPGSITDIVRYMDKMEPDQNYYERQADSCGDCSGTRGKLRKFAKKNPNHLAIRHWVETKKWQPPDQESFFALIELIKTMIK